MLNSLLLLANKANQTENILRQLDIKGQYYLLLWQIKGWLLENVFLKGWCKISSPYFNSVLCPCGQVFTNNIQRPHVITADSVHSLSKAYSWFVSHTLKNVETKGIERFLHHWYCLFYLITSCVPFQSNQPNQQITEALWKNKGKKKSSACLFSVQWPAYYDWRCCFSIECTPTWPIFRMTCTVCHQYKALDIP